MSMEVIVTIVSKLGYFTYLRDVFTTYLYRGEHPSIDPKYQQDIPSCKGPQDSNMLVNT